MLKVICLLLTVPCGAFCQPAPYCNGVAIVGCATPTINVIEKPQGAIDGNNRVFYVRKTAIPGTIRVIRNGLELTSGVDYQAIGNSVRVEPSAIPQANDQFMISFEIPDPHGSPQQPPQPKMNLSKPNSSTRTITVRSLNESLQKLEQPAARETALPIQSTDALAERRASDAGATKTLSSLLLLDRSLDLNTVHRKKRLSSEIYDLSGIEGTGDISVSTPFLPTRDFSYAKVSTPQSTSGLAGTTSRAGRFRSLSLLQERLNRVQETPEASQPGNGK